MPETSPSVLHLITRFNDGGAEAVVTDLVTGLDHRYDFTVGHGAEYDSQRLKTLETAGIDTVGFRLLRHYNPVTMLPAVGSVANYLRHNAVDLVHTHSTEAGIVGRLAACAVGTPVVHTVHGIPFTEDRNAALNHFVRACERVAARCSDRLLTNADQMAAAYLQQGIGRPDQYTTVPVGIDREKFASASPATDLPGDRPRILSVGRLADGKGFETLLGAVERMDDQSSPVAIAGDGPLRQSLEREIDRRGLGGRVSLLGYRDDVARLLAASDIFALPSFREGTPLSITEAMAAGLPVVATTVGGVPEQVRDGETGYLVSPGNVSALADRLDRLLADSDRRRRLGAAGRERSAAFTVAEMRSRVDGVYTALLHE